jgi:hypothetical protein
VIYLRYNVVQSDAESERFNLDKEINVLIEGLATFYRREEGMGTSDLIFIASLLMVSGRISTMHVVVQQ